MQFLARTCRFATDYYKNRQLRHFGERQNLWTVLEDFTRTIHQSLDPKWTAYTVANEGRRLIGCDRVSVALRSGNACPITAISGQDTINKRSTTVRLLGKLAAAVLKAGEPIWYTGSTTDFPPQIEKAIEKYVDESHSKMIAVHPLLHRTKESDDQKEHSKRKSGGHKPPGAFGVLIVEQIGDSQITEQTRKRIGIVAEHAGSALGNTLEHHSIFLLPLWKVLGKSQKLVARETLPKTLTVTASVLVLLAVLLFMPYRFQMHCPGTLEPIRRHRIYAPLDAEIEELYVDHNTSVEGPSEGFRGTTLVKLRSPDLESLEVQLRGELKQEVEKLTSLERMLLDQDRRLSDYERADLVGQKVKAATQYETVEKKLEIFELYQKPELFITAPMDGVVVSWDLTRRLVPKRPISRMQYVMEIVDLEGAWQLELSMPEKRMGYIMDRQRRQPELPLRVEFVLAADPGQKKYYGTVMEIHDRAEVRSDSGGAGTPSDNVNTVSIKVALDDLALLPRPLRPGGACSARIDCGKRPLGYVIFYEVIAFVQNLWFRWF
jgi:hypothetical protein